MAEDLTAGLIDFSAGAQIASYQLEEEIGQGGMAAVYRARDVRLGRWVALKVLAQDYAQDEAFRQRFIRESRTAASVDHPNIIPIFDAGEAGGVLYIAMRYVAGQDVHSLLRSAGPLPVARALSIVGQVAAALDAAHACGLVHRDVKPANMLLGGVADTGRADHVYLSDFGISKMLNATSSLTMTGQVLGTLNYLAPEQIEGRQVDGRADAYALACTAFELLAGSPPFRRDENMAVMWAQLNAAPPRLTSLRPGLPPAVDRVLARGLAKSPAERFASCVAFSAALHQACAPVLDGAAGPVPGSAPPRAARPAAPTAADPVPAPATAPPAPAAPADAPARPATTPMPVPHRPARTARKRRRHLPRPRVWPCSRWAAVCTRCCMTPRCATGRRPRPGRRDRAPRPARPRPPRPARSGPTTRRSATTSTCGPGTSAGSTAAAAAAASRSASSRTGSARPRRTR